MRFNLSGIRDLSGRHGRLAPRISRWGLEVQSQTTGTGDRVRMMDSIRELSYPRSSFRIRIFSSDGTGSRPAAEEGGRSGGSEPWTRGPTRALNKMLRWGIIQQGRQDIQSAPCLAEAKVQADVLANLAASFIPTG